MPVSSPCIDVARNGNRNDVWYSADGEHWGELLDIPWSRCCACGIHVHRDAMFLVAGNAITISADQVEQSKRDLESAWRPGDVWRLDRRYARRT